MHFNESFFKAVQKAFDGEWVLPKFQRDLKWKRNQNILLFDSLRCGYPIGTILCAKPGALTHHRNFEFSSAKPNVEYEYFVLDGQQRLSAGIQLFFSDMTSQKSHYFVDLNRLQTLLNEYRNTNPEFDMNNQDQCALFEEEMLDSDSGYLVAKTNVKNPHTEFEKKGLIWTALLRQNNTKKYETHRDDFLNKNPDMTEVVDLFRLVIKEKDFGLSMPVIVVESKDPKILSRIFSTLNNTGTSLTPFEITVSEMFGQGVDLVDEIEKLTSASNIYKNMDRDRNMLLQACVLRGSTENHKKSNLPKTLTREIWENNSKTCVENIIKLGDYLTEKMGVGLDYSPNYVPYDTALLPLSHLFDHCDLDEMTPNQKVCFEKIVTTYFVGAALKLHYTEGAVSKQSHDKEVLLRAFQQNDLNLVRQIFENKSFPGLNDVTNSGARGRVAICIQSTQNLNDVVTGTKVSTSDAHEIHHIFPKSFFKNKQSDISQNHIANLMLTHGETNNAFSGSTPDAQVTIAQGQNKNFEADYALHFIDDKALKILKTQNPTMDDYEAFIKTRSANIVDYIAKKYELEIDNADPDSNVDVEEQSD